MLPLQLLVLLLQLGQAAPPLVQRALQLAGAGLLRLPGRLRVPQLCVGVRQLQPRGALQVCLGRGVQRVRVGA